MARLPFDFTEYASTGSASANASWMERAWCSMVARL